MAAHKSYFLRILTLLIQVWGKAFINETGKRRLPVCVEGTYHQILVCGSFGLRQWKAHDINLHVPILEESKGVQMNLMPHVILKRFAEVKLVIGRRSSLDYLTYLFAWKTSLVSC